MTPSAETFTPRSRRGFALVAVLWVVVIAGLILLGVQRNSWANNLMARNEVASVQAHWLARAGLEQALAVLEDDETNVDSSEDDWYDNPELFADVELTGGKFRLTALDHDSTDPTARRAGVTDLAGCLNVNTADIAQFRTFEFLDESQIASIRDWVDSDSNVRSGGAEAGYYQRLTHPYLIRNGPMQTLRELLLVKGVDLQSFYGQGSVDSYSGMDSSAMSSLQPSGLADLCTVYSYELNKKSDGSDRINVSTANKQKLTQDLNLSDALADGLIQQRQRGRFYSLFELLNVKAAQSSSRPAGSSGVSRTSTSRPAAGGSANTRRRSGSGNSSGQTTTRNSSAQSSRRSTRGSTSQPSQSTQQQGKTNEFSIKWLADHFDELSVNNQQKLPARINVNTASREVLMTLPNVTREVAEGIISRRSGPRGAYKNVGELLGDGLDDTQFRACAERCTVRSSVFEIRSSAVTAWGIRSEIQAVVDRGSKPVTILYWYQSE